MIKDAYGTKLLPLADQLENKQIMLWLTLRFLRG